MPGGGAEMSGSIQLPWQAIPRFIPGTTDVTEYSGKLKFLAAMWPKEHLALLAPRAALLTEGTAFKKVAKIDAEKLKSSDDSGVRLLVATLGGSWGKTALEEKYDCFEKAIYGTVLAPVELPFEAWQPVFQAAAQCTTRGTTTLVSPQSDLIGVLQQRLPEIKILQVFVGRGSRNLQSPLGALPQTVAPLRFSVGSRLDANTGKEAFWCLGKEDRLSMSPERKRVRIEPVSILITVFGQVSASPTERHPSEPQASESGTATSSQVKPDMEAWGPPPIPIHGPAFRNLTKEEKSTLVRAHNNLGHPAPQTLANHLRSAGASPSIVQGALEYQCDSCLESIEPRLQRPSKLPEPREFNDLIGVDGFLFKSRSGYKGYVLHALDEASCFLVYLGR